MMESSKKTGRKRKPAYSENSWGERLMAVLNESHLSIRGAAKIAQVSPSTIDSWLKGGIPADPKALSKLADHMKVDFRWLLVGERQSTESTPSLAEIFEEQNYFDGYARIRIDRLIERKKK